MHQRLSGAPVDAALAKAQASEARTLQDLLRQLARDETPAMLAEL